MDNKYQSRGQIRSLPRKGIKQASVRYFFVKSSIDSNSFKMQPEKSISTKLITSHIYTLESKSRTKEVITQTNTNMINRSAINNQNEYYLTTSETDNEDNTVKLKKALESELEPHKKIIKKEINRHPGKHLVNRLVYGLVILIILSITGYVSFTTWQTNNQVTQALTKTAPAIIQPNIEEDKEKETLSIFDNYKVAPDVPRTININKINVSAKILPMGLNSDNSLQAPTGDDAGWYTGSGKPGQDGAMLIDGHASETGTHLGLFGYLIDLKEGDQITIERGDNTKFNYKIVHTEIVPLVDVKMSKMLVPYGNAKQGVNLIACTGQWTADKSTLDHRLLVYATLQ